MLVIFQHKKSGMRVTMVADTIEDATDKLSTLFNPNDLIAVDTNISEEAELWRYEFLEVFNNNRVVVLSNSYDAAWSTAISVLETHNLGLLSSQPIC